MKVLEIKGYKGYLALQSYNHLMLGLKMLPSYLGETYEEFYARLADMPESDQEKMIREAAAFVKLEDDELDSLIAFTVDANGVPWGRENKRNLGPKEIHEIVVAVCKEIAKIRINLVSEDEKKNSLSSA